MSSEIAIAVVGDLSSPPPGALSPDDADQSWESRLQVAVSPHDYESLGEVVDHAAALLGVESFLTGRSASETFPWIAFHDGTDRLPRPFVERVDVVDDHQELIFRARWQAISVGQLMAARQLGLIDGDPQRVYLVRQAPAGGGPDFELGWRLFIELLRLVGELEALGFLARSLAAGVHVIRRRWPQWSQRNGTPASLAAFLSRRAWSSLEVADLLGCEPSEAADILSLFGYAETRSGRFERGTTAGARVLMALTDDIIQRGYQELRGTYDIDRLLTDVTRRIVEDPEKTPEFSLDQYFIQRRGDANT